MIILVNGVISIFIYTGSLLLMHHIFHCSKIVSGAKNEPVSLTVRLDISNLSKYYRLSGEALVTLKLSFSCSSYDVDCISHSHSQSVNDYLYLL